MVIKPHPDFMKAGRIAGRVLSTVTKEIRPGVKVLKICTMAEESLMRLGASGLAFPCNISIDNEAAHYTSPHGDTRVFPDKGLVKIDLGAHVNGYISDTALTVDLDGSYEKYLAAARNALEDAIAAVRPGVKLGDVGRTIERRIKSYGLRPVHQLTGHQLKQWSLHAGKNVPNVGARGLPSMNLGETFAIEPFATNGNGTVRNGAHSYIFSNVMKNKKKIDRDALRVRNHARHVFGTLPWASRWLHGKIKGINVDAAIHNLQRVGAIRGYPVLLEGKDGIVSQFEHSIFVGEDGAIVSTRRDDELL
ncbi:MAG: type II methionyl aminopeptidase [Candidatus Thorarchaeota archaeon]|nr:MAG: type II methionyl aminopeptidase [Candidatus Thorarchaeota archaeon]RLI60156.1 MAG: type II methionyl aminopeptidase [Candidatus Thorarchaeota archaeon]